MPISCKISRPAVVCIGTSLMALLTACGGGNGASADETVEASNAFSDSMSTIERGRPEKLGSLFVDWDAPTTSADGSPLKDLAGYHVKIGNSSGTYSTSITVNDPSALTYEFKELRVGTYYVAVTAFDSAQNESLASAEQSKTLH